MDSWGTGKIPLRFPPYRKLPNNPPPVPYISAVPSPLLPPSKDFWLEDPYKLIESLEILPGANASAGQRLNAMTRASLVIAAIMYLCKFPAWHLFLIIALISIIILWYILRLYPPAASGAALHKEYIRKPLTNSKSKPILQAIPALPAAPTGSTPLQQVQNQTLHIIAPVTYKHW